MRFIWRGYRKMEEEGVGLLHSQGRRRALPLGCRGPLPPLPTSRYASLLAVSGVVASPVSLLNDLHVATHVSTHSRLARTHARTHNISCAQTPFTQWLLSQSIWGWCRVKMLCDFSWIIICTDLAMNSKPDWIISPWYVDYCECLPFQIHCDFHSWFSDI